MATPKPGAKQPKPQPKTPDQPFNAGNIPVLGWFWDQTANTWKQSVGLYNALQPPGSGQQPSVPGVPQKPDQSPQPLQLPSIPTPATPSPLQLGDLGPYFPMIIIVFILIIIIKR